MKKLSQINEGWGSLVRRDLTNEVRDEEKSIFEGNNLDKIKFVDLGTGVLWADRLYENVNGLYFSYDEAMRLNRILAPRGVRLAENEEFYELAKIEAYHELLCVGNKDIIRYPEVGVVDINGNVKNKDNVILSWTTTPTTLSGSKSCIGVVYGQISEKHRMDTVSENLKISIILVKSK